MNILCDTETCNTCGIDTVAGNDQNGECVTCSSDGSLDKMLRLMAAGVTREPATGRFVNISKKG